MNAIETRLSTDIADAIFGNEDSLTVKAIVTALHNNCTEDQIKCIYVDFIIELEKE